jgi:uncharacterized protein
MTAPKRTLPVVDKDSQAFWTRGQAGELAIYRCGHCQYYVHPPVRFCPRCESRNVGPVAVSGKGRVATYTVNHKQWVADLPTPYVLALVELIEQSDVRLPTNIVNCAPESVHIGMPVRVLFEQAEDLWVPLFEPDLQR